MRLAALAHPRAWLGAWAWRAVSGIALSAPLVALVRSSGITAFERGDARLFEPGGQWLVDLVLGQLAGARAALWQGSWLLVLLAYLGLIPLGAVLASLRDGDRDLPRAVATSLRHLPALSFALGAALLGQALLLALGALLIGPRMAVLSAALGDRRGDLATLGLLAPFVLGALALGVGHDLARAVVVVHAERGTRAMLHGLRLLRAHPLAAATRWAGTALVSAALVYVALQSAGALQVARGESWRWLSALVLHQLTVLLILALRMQWLAWAVDLAKRSPLSADKDAGSAAPGDPSSSPVA